MIKKILLMLLVMVSLSACSELELGSYVAKQFSFPSDSKSNVGDFKVGNPYKVKGRTYNPTEQYQYSETGIASWYGPGFQGKRTANGEKFNKYELTAAHKTLQMPSIARVTNLENGKSIIVRINDRGPFSSDRILDLSEKAADILDMKRAGTARVRLDVLEKESRQVASAAKNGLSTRGTEMAFNRGQSLHPKMDVAVVMPVSKPSNGRTTSTKLAGNYGGASLHPLSVDQVHLTTRSPAISAPQSYFIQAGAFSNEDNALTMKNALYNVSEPVNVYRSVESGNPVYRVKIGPVTTVEKANKIITLLNRQGRDATMAIAQN